MTISEANSLPAAIKPLFTCDVDASIPLFEGEGILTVGREVSRGPCEIRFAWNPNLGAELRFRGLVRGLEADTTLEIPAIGLRAEVLARRTQWGTEAPEFEGLFNGPIELGNGAAVTQVLFHLANFHSVLGEPIQREGGTFAARLSLVSDPWAVTIDPVADPTPDASRPLAVRLEQQRGHAITHVGQLTRVDGAPFDVCDSHEVLHDVGRTLSLARAAYSVPLLRVGFDRSGARVWQSWTAFRTDAWRTHENWFSTRHPRVLQSVFDGWRRQAARPNGDLLGAALNLYIDAHAPGLVTESRLVLLQAALEGLADNWPHPPLTGLPHTRGDASGRIARMAASLGLPAALPQLSHLCALPRPAPNASEIEKMVWVRNSIAHLELLPRLTPHPSLVRFEAKQIGALHLELALLRMLDADGQYINRVTASGRWDADRLPWLP